MIRKLRDGGSWLIGSLLLWSVPSRAASFVSLTTMNDVFVSLRSHEQDIIRLIVATAYIMGLCFVFSALHNLKKVGRTMGSMMGTQETMTAPLVKMIFGILLMYLPSTVNVGLQTIWGSSASILKYTGSTVDLFSGLKGGMIVLMRVVGYISLIKGLVMLSRSASGHGGVQQGGAGKGILNVVGGILAINIVGTIRLVGSVLGLDLI